MANPRSFSLVFGLALTAFAASVSGSGSGTTGTGKLASTGLTATINGIDYYVSPYSAGQLSTSVCSSIASLPAVFGFVPVTVVQDSSASTKSLPQLFTSWESTDDVFQAGFLGAVLLPAPSHARSQPSCRSETPSVWSSTLLPVSGKKPLVFSALAPTSVPSGPYFLNAHTGAFYPAYRLYNDFSASFLESVLQTPQGTFQPLSARTAGSSTLTIGVPSRLYYTRTAKKPLAGVRVGIKDIYRLNGVRGSNGNRAWYNLYPPSNATGPAIQRLIDAGAIIVGLQTPSQFANGETATADWVDYHAPFNPRGDGYQDPSSSSSGAGASIASYAWLDLALGSDTGGSIRGPAGVSGLFGNRPTHDLVSLDHVMPLSPDLDTPGFLTRDPYLWDVAQAVLYGPKNYTSLAAPAVPDYPKTIYVLDFLSNKRSTADSDTIITTFLDGLARVTNGTYEPFVLEDAWKATGPAGLANTTTLASMLSTTYPTLIAKDQTALVRDPFYADYAAAHDGRRPFVDPVPLARWAYGDSLPASARDAAAANKTIFADWFNANVLKKESDPSRCSSSLVVYIGSSGAGKNYRNVYLSDPQAPLGFSSGRISPFAGCPDVVFPLREEATVQNDSITGHAEQYPIGVDVLAARGCDGLLARLAQDLTAAGVIIEPGVGPTIF